MRLQNDTIYNVSLVALAHGRLNRTDHCSRLIEGLAAQGRPVSVIVEALKADVVFTVTWNDSLQVGANDSTLNALGRMLGIQHASTGNSTIAGKSLFLGFYDEPFGWLGAKGQIGVGGDTLFQVTRPPGAQGRLPSSERSATSWLGVGRVVMAVDSVPQ
jgi:hypothetical protein